MKLFGVDLFPGGLAWLLTLIVVSGCSNAEQLDNSAGHASGTRQKDAYVLAGEKNFYSGYEPRDASGEVQVVVEIPAGTNEKWEVRKNSGNLEWDFKEGKPRVVEYLSYPGNYGMIPRTLFPEESGGDGDPLDVIVLGPAMPRGTVVPVRIIGMIRMLDGGEQDDKLIAVMRDSHFGDIKSLKELDSRYKGAVRILELWFSNYKGPGVMESRGIADAEEANRVLQTAINAYVQAVDNQ